MRSKGALQIPPLRYASVDKGSVVTFRKGGDLEGQTYERLLSEICVSHPSQKTRRMGRIPREGQMLLPAVTAWGTRRLPRFPVRSSGQDHVCAFLLRKGA